MNFDPNGNIPVPNAFNCVLEQEWIHKGRARETSGHTCLEWHIMATQKCSSSSKLHQCDVFVFGISGATCSGKSAVTDYLCDTQQHTIVIHQDDYYLPDRLIPRTESGTYTNWDIIEAIDTSKFLETLRTAIKYPHRSCEECSSARSEPCSTSCHTHCAGRRNNDPRCEGAV